MRVVHTVARLAPGKGGPSESVPALCRALVAAGAEVTLVTGAGEVSDAVRALEAVAKVLYVRLGPYAAAHVGLSLGRELRALAGSADLLHGHGIWLHPNWASARAARRQGVPFVVSPRGMLAPRALASSRWRKRAAWLLLDGRHLRGAALVHATSPEEARQVRAAGIAAPIAVIGNGVDTTVLCPPEAAAGRGRTSPRAGVLFLGRIHPIKGIDLLLDAWRLVAGARRDVPELLLAGPGEERHVAWLRRELAARSLPGARYLGPVRGSEKLELLRGVRALVLPSRSENYGLVVAEALACGTPVVATTGTPWSALASERCGWHVEPSPTDLAQGLAELLEASDEAIEAMGLRGRAFVEREHSLSATATRMLAAYAWVLGRGDRPAGVLDRDEAA